VVKRKRREWEEKYGYSVLRGGGLRRVTLGQGENRARARAEERMERLFERDAEEFSVVTALDVGMGTGNGEGKYEKAFGFWGFV